MSLPPRAIYARMTWEFYRAGLMRWRKRIVKLQPQEAEVILFLVVHHRRTVTMREIADFVFYGRADGGPLCYVQCIHERLGDISRRIGERVIVNRAPAKATGQYQLRGPDDV